MQAVNEKYKSLGFISCLMCVCGQTLYFVNYTLSFSAAFRWCLRLGRGLLPSTAMSGSRIHLFFSSRLNIPSLWLRITDEAASGFAIYIFV